MFHYSHLNCFVEETSPKYQLFYLIVYSQESERVVTKKEGIDFAREYGCLFLECSAKTRVNVEQCFEELVLKVCHPALLLASFVTRT